MFLYIGVSIQIFLLFARLDTHMPPVQLYLGDYLLKQEFIYI